MGREYETDDYSALRNVIGVREQKEEDIFKLNNADTVETEHAV